MTTYKVTISITRQDADAIENAVMILQGTTDQITIVAAVEVENIANALDHVASLLKTAIGA